MARSLRRETELQCSGQRFYFSGDFFKNNFSFKRKKLKQRQGWGRRRKRKEGRKKEGKREGEERNRREGGRKPEKSPVKQMWKMKQQRYCF